MYSIWTLVFSFYIFKKIKKIIGQFVFMSKRCRFLSCARLFFYMFHMEEWMFATIIISHNNAEVSIHYQSLFTRYIFFKKKFNLELYIFSFNVFIRVIIHQNQ